MTYVIEGIWSGYRGGGKVEHREYTTDVLRADACKKLHSIIFTDGTSLTLKVYEDRLPAIDGYTALIDKCIRHGVRHVSELP